MGRRELAFLGRQTAQIDGRPKCPFAERGRQTKLEAAEIGEEQKKGKTGERVVEEKAKSIWVAFGGKPVGWQGKKEGKTGRQSHTNGKEGR